MQPLSSLLQVIRERAGRIAVSCYGKDWTYEELESLVARLSAGLLHAGFGPQTLLATMIPNCVEQLALHLAALRVGVPLVRLNTSYVAPQLAYCLRQTQPLGLIADASFAHMLTEAAISVAPDYVWLIGPPVAPFRNFSELLDAGSESNIADLNPETMATITFTSGTTDRPKGVLHSRAAVGWAVAKSLALLKYRADDVTLVRLPLNYQIGLFLQTLPTLVAGGRVELLRGASAGVYAEALRRPPKKTILFDAPTTLLELMRHPERSTFDFTAVRWLLAGGDFVPHRLRVMARNLTGCEVSAAYGLTEAGLVTCQTDHLKAQPIQSIGRPAPATRIRIRGETGSESACGDPGAILVQSGSQMSAYWQMPDLTERVVAPDGWIDTGDVGAQRPDGQLDFLGRRKEIIVRDGFKISPFEVEAVLVAHPGVWQAGVTGVSDDDHGERVEAFVVLRENFEPSPSEFDLRDLASEQLAAYMIPERIRFVTRLPFLPSGKLDRARLRLLAELDHFDETLI